MAFEVNRDAIRTAAKAAGISNVSYRTKAENIELLKHAGVVDVLDSGEPVWNVETAIHEVAEAHRTARESEAEEKTEEKAAVRYHTSVDDKGRSQVTVVVDGNMTTVDETHPNYSRIVTALLADEDPTPWLDASSEKLLQQVVNVLGEDSAIVTDEHGEHHLYLGGTEVDGKLVDKFISFWADDQPFDGLLKFLERVNMNPLPVAEIGLYNWDSALTIDDDGYFIGFKSVIPTEGGFRPAYNGPGYVNGIAAEPGQYIVQNVGDVVTMDRDSIEPGPECGIGLHVGTWNYASTYNGGRGVVMEVRVDPADIINVPSYHSGKLRCCRYEIVAIHSDKSGDLSHYEPERKEPELPNDPEVKSFFKRLFTRKGK